MNTTRACAKYIYIITINVIAVLLIGEIICRAFFHQSMNFDMEMWRYANLLKQQSNYTGLGHEHRPSTSAFLMGVQVDLNSFGMRGPEVSFIKGKNVFRIALLGDSLTMGWGVPQNQIYGHLLEEYLNLSPPKGFDKNTRFEVLNFGVGNYNTVQEVTLLRHKAMSFKPDMILLGYFINDAEKLTPQSADFFITHSFLYAFGKSVINNYLSSQPENYSDYYRSLYRSDQVGWRECQQSLRDLAAISKQQQVPAMIFILPELHDLTNKYPFADIHQDLARIASEIDIPTEDLLGNFTAYAGREQELWVSPTDAHPNFIVQPIIAQAIYNKVPWQKFSKKGL